jgi:predicted methyltransferase
MSIARLSLSLLMVLVLASCSTPQNSSTEIPAAESANKVMSPIRMAVNGAWRTADDRSRDVYRHPVEALEFWGLEPGMTILEVQPGGGWWTEILAPFAKATGGKFYVTAADLNNPEVSADARKGRDAFAARFAAKPEIYGTVNLVNFGPKSAPLPANKFDFILTARSAHGWINGKVAEKMFADFYQALKPGGILALEQHRADEGTLATDPLLGTGSGYVMQSTIVDLAAKAGFVLDASSEINANAADTKDHPFGVWTLPPASRTRPYSEGPTAHDPKFDTKKYQAIGESDRMTLKFRKPKMAY